LLYQLATLIGSHKKHYSLDDVVAAPGRSSRPFKVLLLAERILPRASDLWVQASLDDKQRLQQLFFPEGIAYDGNRFNRTAATAPLSSPWRRPSVLMKRW
jgi:hypothetical protein